MQMKNALCMSRTQIVAENKKEGHPPFYFHFNVLLIKIKRQEHQAIF